MWKVNLVLADIDERYIESLSKFIRGSFVNKFNVNVFTDRVSLIKFLENSKGKLDILMLGPEMYCEEINKFKPQTTVILADTGELHGYCGLTCINKFQPGDAIMSIILELYSSIGINAVSLVKGSRASTLISVFSPAGGSGKTAISMALSVTLASMGLKTLYLNLETINSMPFFIKNLNTGKGMSNLLFYLKESKKNLAIKIDTLKNFDSTLGISFFNPADCALEMDELTEFDIGTLLFELKEIKQFDVLVSDMDSALNRRNMAVLNCSSSIVMPLIQEDLSLFKVGLFEKELEKINLSQEEPVTKKIIPVINRFRPELTPKELNFLGREVLLKIPDDGNYKLGSFDRQVFSPESSFMKGISEVLKQAFSSAGLNLRKA